MLNVRCLFASVGVLILSSACSQPMLDKAVESLNAQIIWVVNKSGVDIASDDWSVTIPQDFRCDGVGDIRVSTSVPNTISFEISGNTMTATIFAEESSWVGNTENETFRFAALLSITYPYNPSTGKISAPGTLNAGAENYVLAKSAIENSERELFDEAKIADAVKAVRCTDPTTKEDEEELDPNGA